MKIRVQEQGTVVTPHVGVWIETLIQTISVQPILVTPHVGVWIETQMGSG